MRRASPYSKLGGAILRVVPKLGKVQSSELVKLSAFPVAATVIGSACLDHRVTGGRLSSWRAWPLQAGGEREGRRMGRKNNLWTCPFWDSKCSSPRAQDHCWTAGSCIPLSFCCQRMSLHETSVVSRSHYLYIGNRGNSRIEMCGVWAALDFTLRKKSSTNVLN